MRRGDGVGGWREDLPLDTGLPGHLSVDCTALRLPIHPMFLLRLRTFVEWHERAGRKILVIAPSDDAANRMFSAVGAWTELSATNVTFEGLVQTTESHNAIVPFTRLSDHTAVEEVAEKARLILEYEMIDLAPLGAAGYMAISELCGNAIEHGRDEMGAAVAMVRCEEPRRQVQLAISDLGIGIPEHLRSIYPEWSDEFAVAQAMERGITGTGHPHRGNGFSETFEAALASTLHAARIEVHSGRGFVRREIVQERIRTEAFPPASSRRGTWITYDLTTVL